MSFDSNVDDLEDMKISARQKSAPSGFSLLELLVVVAVMAIMMSLLAPAVAGFSSTAGRRGAVNIVMNTFEQARVAALESGQTVYIGFADAEFPVEDMRYAAFIVFRDATDEEKNDPVSPRNYVVLKKWTRLPKRIAFKRIDSSLVPTTTSGSQLFGGLKNELGSSLSSWNEEMPVIAFNSSGAVAQPSNNLRIYLYEGYFGDGKDNLTRNNSVQEGSSGLFEKISVSRYTGRAQLDITTTSS